MFKAIGVNLGKKKKVKALPHGMYRSPGDLKT